MRGIPDKLATRQDVYNVAMDLPPDAAKTFLASLTPEKVKGLLNAEELILLKGKVDEARQKEAGWQNRKTQKRAEIDQATKNLAALRKARRSETGRLKKTHNQIGKTKKQLDALNAPMVDQRQDLQEKISLEENQLDTMAGRQLTMAGQVKAMAVKKAAIETQAQQLDQELETHEKNLAAGHSKATKKKISAARKKLASLKSDQKRRQKQLQRLPGKIKQAAKKIEETQGNLDTLNTPKADRRQDLQEKINQEENLLDTIRGQLQDLTDQAKAMAAKKAAIEKQAQQLDQELETHEKDLAAGHSMATKKKISAAAKKLAKYQARHARLTRGLVKNGVEIKAATGLIDSLTNQMGELKNG